MTPYYEDDSVRLFHGDCFDLLPELTADAVVTDPPYGDTSLPWDARPHSDWLGLAGITSSTLWCFGSMRFFLSQWPGFEAQGWQYAQELVWEKHNGSGFHADRFKRVHELAVHFYRGPWGEQRREVPTTNDARARTVRRKARPAHTGHIEQASYVSEDGGPRLMRSVVQVRSEHGRAVHPTQKPLGILRPLIEYSVPVGGMVVDPFAGSGSTLIAARQLGRKAIGIELQEQYCERAAERLSQLDLFGGEAA